ncbi:MAG: cephalosporin hydroxylase family protein [Candidatus Omnitrophica bacterium]|nr:cephalosporin hydroxylase family protein [Candidatus Omnitrophota bacterium]
MGNNEKKTRLTKIILFVTCMIFLISFNIYINTGRRLVNRFQGYFLKQVFREPYSRPTFLGVRSMQFPSDNWVAQEIIYEIKPDFILEIGTAEGGTALFYATILEKVNEQGKVITVSRDSPDEWRKRVDEKMKKYSHKEVIGQKNIPKAYEYKIWKEKIIFIEGNSEDPRIVDRVTKMIEGRKVFILLDSLKKKNHVLKNLSHYALPVAAGSYVMVHDTATPEAYEAVQEFVKANDNFQIDRSRERFLVTLSPSGFLKKIK